MLLKPIYMRRPPADYQLNTADADVDDDVTILQPSVKLLRTESPPTIYDQICKQCGCEFNRSPFADTYVIFQGEISKQWLLAEAAQLQQVPRT